MMHVISTIMTCNRALFILLATLLMIVFSTHAAENSVEGEDPSINEDNQANDKDSGGTLTIGVITNIRQLDPHKVLSFEEIFISQLIGEKLFDVDPDGNVYPVIGTELASSNDYKTWRVSIDTNRVFSDGSPVTVDDVKASFERIADPETGSFFSLNAPYIESVSTEGDDTVVFELTEPFAAFDELLTHISALVLPKTSFDTAGKNPIGSGPFKFESYDPGNELILTRNDRYHDPELPHLDKIVVRILPDQAQREQALLAGEIDLMHWLPSDAVTRLQRAEGVHIARAQANTFQPIVMDVTAEPFDDANVRKALQHIVDREQLVQVALFGTGQAVNGFPESPDSSLYPSNVPMPEKDLELAAELMQSSSYPDGVEVTLYYGAGVPDWDRVAQIMQQNASEIGIDMELQSVPRDEFFANIEGQEAFYIESWIHDVNMDFHISTWFESGRGFNLANMEEAEIDVLLKEARQERDPEELRSIYGRITNILNERGGYLIYYVKDTIHGVSDRVHGFRAHPDNGRLVLREVSVSQ